MKVFFDTEFTGLHQHTTLISIGMVAEDGCNFYAEFTDYDRKQVDPWIEKNVIAHLKYSAAPGVHAAWRLTPDDPGSWRACGTRHNVKNDLWVWLKHIAESGQVEMWGDCLAYDWVLFCELFGGALKLPPQVSIYPHDLATLLMLKDLDLDLGRRTFSGMTGSVQHHALADAEVIRACYDKVMSLEDFDEAGGR